ncbi:MAG: hypothetical protein ACI383_13085 [Rummeliibacillus sp.]
MKTNLIKLFILLYILFTLAACNTSHPEASQPIEATQSITRPQPISTRSTTDITQVTDNAIGNDEYHGTATDTDEGIYFTSDYIQSSRPTI